MLLGYGRVSKGEDQNNALQVEALERAGCTRIFSETASGGRWDRPELHRMLDQLRADCRSGQIDGVIFASLDRLARSVRHEENEEHLFRRTGG